MRKSTVLGLLLLTAAAPLSAQTGGPPGAGRGQGPATMIQGSVQDREAGTSLAAASVELWSAGDSSLVTGTLSDDAGRFAIQGVRPGSYYVRVTYLGYGTRVVDSVAVTPQTPRVDLGVIGMAPQAMEVEGLVVEGQRSAVQLAVDRTIYNTDQMPATAGGNATDVLRNVPAVEVDIDGNVSLRGNSNVAIQINGRPAPLRGEALTNFLGTIPASMLEKVEVIPNPSAKHDPEGMGGIINIVLKQNADLGWSGGLTLGAGTGDRYNGSANVGYQGGPLTLMGSYGISDDVRDNDGLTFRANLYQDPVTYFDQQTHGANDFQGHVLNLSGDYKLTERNSVFANVVGNMRDFDALNLNEYVVLDAARAPIDLYDRFSHTEGDNRTLDVAGGFRRVVTPQRDELTTELRWTTSTDENRSRFELEPGAGSSALPSLERTAVDESNDQFVAQLDWMRPFGETVKLEAGYKGSLRMLENGQTERFFGDDQVQDSIFTNDFDYDENVQALYALASKDFGDWDVQGGVRVEQTLTDFQLPGQGASYENDYLSWFPSGSVLYSFDEYGTKSLRASYARRIQRPNTRFLNPFSFREDQLNRFEGNPYLGPEYTDAYELTYAHSGTLGTLQLTPFYRRTTDVIRRYKSVDTSGVSITTLRNLDESDSWGADMNGSFRLGPVNGFAGLSAYQVQTSGDNVEAGLGSESFSWSARVSASYRVTESTEVQWFQFYRAPMDIEQGRISGFSMANLAVRQKFGENASFTLRVMDPFDQMKFTFETADETHTQITEREFDARAVYLQFNYTWGQQPRLRPRNREPQGDGGTPDIGIG